MSGTIDYEGTANITCPHCGYVDIDSWEQPDSGEDVCGACGEEFHFERDVCVSYTTCKKEVQG